MGPWFRLAWRPLRNHRRFSLFYCMNLALGLSGFIALDAFRSSLEIELGKGSRSMLGADIKVDVRNREFTAEESQSFLDLLGPGSKTHHSYTLFTMAATANKSRLIRLVGITKSYPLYGKLILQKTGLVQETTSKSILKKPEVWIYREVAVQLGLEIGSSLKIGNRTLRVADIVEVDSSGTASAFNFAPKVFIDDSLIKGLELMLPGSRFRETYYAKLADPSSFKTTGKSIWEHFKETRDIRIKTHKNASEDLARSLTFLTDYLGLIALVALFMSALGSAYLFRSYLVSKQKEIATLMSLGATGSDSRRLYIIQLMILGTLSALLAISIAALSFPLVPIISKGLMPIVLYPSLSPRVVLLALAMGSFGSLLICLPMLAKIKELSPALLFHDFSLAGRSNLSHMLLYLPVFALYWAMAIWESQSIFIGSLFMGGFTAAAIAFGLLSWLLFSLLNKISWHRLSIRMACRQLYRNRLSTASCFMAIALGSLLLCLVPQMYLLVSEEISSPAGLELPSLLLVEIQEEQIPGVRQTVEQWGSQLQSVSPLIQGRLQKINGEEVEVLKDGEQPTTREQERRRKVRSRGQNISVRDQLGSAEKIIEGRPFNGSYDWSSDELPEISLEMRFASRLDVGIGDRLTLDIQGVEIESQIVSIRRIKWTSFQPNFFIIMQPGVLDDAPKVFLASIPDLPRDKKYALQNKLVEKFPNISIIDIENTVKRISNIIQKMSMVILIMAIFALFAGLIVLYSIANHQAAARRWDTNLMKVLGAEFSLVRNMVFWESGVLGLSAALCGALGSLVISYTFSKLVFDSPWTPTWASTLCSTLVVTLICIATSLLATRKILQEKPLALLNQN